MIKLDVERHVVRRGLPCGWLLGIRRWNAPDRQIVAALVLALDARQGLVNTGPARYRHARVLIADRRLMFAVDHHASEAAVAAAPWRILPGIRPSDHHFDPTQLAVSVPRICVAVFPTRVPGAAHAPTAV
jgi:hypothetical protein